MDLQLNTLTKISHVESGNRTTSSHGRQSNFASYDAKKTVSAPTTELNAIYQRVYDYFNRELFEGKLPPVFLRFNSLARAKGYYSPCAWTYGPNGKLPEISINPIMLTRPPIEMWSTLAHEMVHHYQFLFGNPGCGGYHNREFAKLMFRVGLICSSTGEPGGKQTGRNVTHYIDQNGLFIKKWRNMPEDCSLLLKPLGTGVLPNTGMPFVKPETRKNKCKYSCCSCGMALWGKPALNVICGTCNTKLIEE